MVLRTRIDKVMLGQRELSTSQIRVMTEFPNERNVSTGSASCNELEDKLHFY